MATRFLGDHDNARKLDQQASFFSQATDIHGDLPPSYHYWSRNYVVPHLEEVSRAKDGIGFYLNALIDYLASRDPAKPVKLASIGCGEAQTEIALARELLRSGLRDFSFLCVDIASGAVNRAKVAAADAGLAEHFIFSVADFQQILRDSSFDIVIANQVLHHVVDLEGLFTVIAEKIADGGLFLSIDMIGRNGHMMWPEALAIMDRLWAGLPESKKFNHVMQRVERQFSNWDNSKEGNEGIRAQDILELLIKNFSFKQFLAVGNLAPALFARQFGGNFDPESADDRAFIDRICRLDQDLIDIGYLKPVLMYAVMTGRNDVAPVVYRHWTPEFCMRRAEDYAVFHEQVTYQLGTLMEFKERSRQTTFLVSGWSSAEIGGVWSNDDRSVVVATLDRPMPGEDVTLSITAMGHVCPPEKPVQRVGVAVNGEPVGTMAFDTTLEAKNFRFPLGRAFQDADTLTITFEHGDSRSPSELGISCDVRRIACFLHSISIDPAVSGL